MIQLARFDRTVINTLGVAVSGASVAIRRQGAQVKGDQSGTSPLTVNVDDIGALVASDTVAINTGSTTYNVDSVSIANQTVTISGFAGTLALTDEDRLTPTNNLPTLYEDGSKNETKANPLTTSSTGQAICWLVGGFYDYIYSGTGLTTTLLRDAYLTANGGPLNPAIRPGAVQIDNTTDDGVSLNNAISDLARTIAGAAGGVIELPKGTLLTSVQIVNKTKIRVVGQGRGATIIQAKAGFTFNGTTDSLVRLGDGTGNVHGCRFETLTLSCNNIANSIACYTTEAQEESGLLHCAIDSPVLYGFYAASGAANVTLRDLEIFISGSGSAATSKGVFLSSTTGVVRVLDCTINNITGSGTTMLAAIHASHTSGHLVVVRGCHFENCTNGIKCSQSGVLISGVTGHATVTNVVLIDSGIGNIGARGIYTAGATNSINDAQLSITLAGDAPFYDAGGIATARVISNNANVTWKVPNPVTWAGAHEFTSSITGSGSASIAGSYAGNPTLSGNPTFSGVPLVSGSLDLSGRVRLNSFENVAINTTISVTKNNVRITGNGPVTLSTIQVDGGAPGAAHDGMEVFIMLSLASTGTMTVDQGGNILLEAGASIAMTAGQCAKFKWVNAESKWLQVAPKAAH